MKTLLKIYVASCLVVVGFFIFFSIPWGLLPFSDAVDLMAVGTLIVTVSAGIVIYNARHEGFEFGWFLAHRGGFWIIVAAVIGLSAILCGGLLFVSPELFVPVFEQGSLPFGMIVVSMFWMALIFMFAFLTFGTLARFAASMRGFKIKAALANLAIGLFCLFLVSVFFSLYMDVINDNAVRIAEGYRRSAAWWFAGVLAAVAFVSGVVANAEETDESEET